MHDNYLWWYLVPILPLSQDDPWSYISQPSSPLRLLSSLDPAVCSLTLLWPEQKPPLRLPHHLLPSESSPLRRVTSALPWCSWTTPASLPFPPALLHASPEPLPAVWPSLSPGEHKLEASTVTPLTRCVSVTSALPVLVHSLSLENTDSRPEGSVGSGEGLSGLQVQVPRGQWGPCREEVLVTVDTLIYASPTPPSRFIIKFCSVNRFKMVVFLSLWTLTTNWYKFHNALAFLRLITV